MRVRDVLQMKDNTRVLSIRRHEPITTAIGQLYENGVGVLVVLDEDDRIVGIVSERDIVRGLARAGAAALDTRVEAHMSRPLQTCRPGDEIRDVMERMTTFRIRHLPVVEDGRLQGMVSIGDVVKHRLREMQTETDVLRDILVAR